MTPTDLERRGDYSQTLDQNGAYRSAVGFSKRAAEVISSLYARGDLSLIDRIERRIATLLNWPLDHGEGLQILRYRPGAQYKPHNDYFDPEQPGTPKIVERGG
jgi:prolyl 4-hydroxylase